MRSKFCISPHVSQAGRWQHAVNIKDLETSVNEARESLERYIIHTDDSSFVCVCNSVSYSSLGHEKYQIACFLFPSRNVPQRRHAHTVPCGGCVIPTERHRWPVCSLKQVAVRETVWASFGEPWQAKSRRERRNKSVRSLLNQYFMMKWASFNSVDPQGKEHTCRQTLPLHRLNACCLKVVCVIVRIEFSPLCLNMTVFNKFYLNYRPFFLLIFFFKCKFCQIHFIFDSVVLASAKSRSVISFQIVMRLTCFILLLPK